MNKEFKSPQHKLVKFFEKSRNKWKEKATQRAYENKLLKKKVKCIESSRLELKEKLKKIEQELEKHRDKDALKKIRVQVPTRNERESDSETEQTHEKDTPQKMIVPLNKDSKQSCLNPLTAANLPHHQYNAAMMLLMMSMVISSYTSLRSTSACIGHILSFFNVSISLPSWSTVRLWLMRVGYYMLMRAKEEAKDWVWIIDHSVQTGQEKCLVILGVRLSNLTREDKTLAHQDTEVIKLLPVKQSNGDIVYQQLEEASKITGVPREIVGDHGPDIKCGIEKFCLAHKETVYIHDVKHHCALLLEHELDTDERWISFKTQASHTKQSLQQTVLSALAPPNQRSKARYMNVDSLITWGAKLLWLLEAPNEIKTIEPTIELEKLTEKLGWVNDYRDDILQEWCPMMDAISITENFVRRSGLFQDAAKKLVLLLNEQSYPARAKGLSNKLITYVKENSEKVKQGETLIGSSEVIESLYGKEKELEKAQSKSGFTGLLLSLPAMVSTLTLEAVEQAMKTVPVKKVKEWYKDNIGASVQSRRKNIFKNYKNKEQIWNQNLGVI